MPHWLSKRVATLEHSATEEVDNLVKQMRRDGITDIVSLGVGEPCFDTPEHLKLATWKALQAGKTKYEPTAGDYDLREAIAGKLKAKNGIDASPEDILVTAGGKFGIFLAFQAVLEQGDAVLLLDPAWVTYEQAARLAGASVIRVPCGRDSGFQPDVDRIRCAMDRAVKVVVINSPCNPTGAVYRPDVVRKIVELAREQDALVLSDEVYEYLLYEGETYSPAADYDGVITVNAFSKTYAMTGWRLGYVTGPREVVEGMVKVYQHSTSCVTSFAQAGATEGLQSPLSGPAVQAMLDGYRRRRGVMLDLIARSQFLECLVPPQGAFYCFPRVKLAVGSAELARRLLEEAHVATVPGMAFGPSGEGHLRLSYATTEEALREAFPRMEQLFRDLASQEDTSRKEQAAGPAWASRRR